METIIFDANAILRYMLYDIPRQADITRKALQNNKILVLPEIIMEVIFVMFKFYNISRKEISEEVSKFLIETNCKNDTLIGAVKNFGVLNLDFADCILLECSKQYDILSFDEKLIKSIQKIKEQND